MGMTVGVAARATFAFASTLRLDTFGFNRLCVYRGTPLWQEYLKRGLVNDANDWYNILDLDVRLGRPLFSSVAHPVSATKRDRIRKRTEIPLTLWSRLESTASLRLRMR
jgi:hypothetical protein